MCMAVGGGLKPGQCCQAVSAFLLLPSRGLGVRLMACGVQVVSNASPLGVSYVVTDVQVGLVFRV